MNTSLSLDHYRLLGRSGLRVSPLALGTMTFGADWGWGAELAEARRLFDVYVERGGNFIDTANRYTEGSAERFVGEFAAGRRDRLVIATKYTLPMQPDDPNSGGNHRKSMLRSVEEACNGSIPITSTCSICTPGISPRRWKRSCAPWTIWYAPGKCCMWQYRIFPPGRRRECKCWRTCVAGRR